MGIMTTISSDAATFYYVLFMFWIIFLKKIIFHVKHMVLHMIFLDWNYCWMCEHMWDTGDYRYWQLETTDTRQYIHCKTTHCRYWKLQILDSINRQRLQIPDSTADIAAVQHVWDTDTGNYRYWQSKNRYQTFYTLEILETTALDTKNSQILQIPDIPADITAIGAPLASQV